MQTSSKRSWLLSLILFTAGGACGDDGGPSANIDGGSPDAAADAAPVLGTCGVEVVASPLMLGVDGLAVLFHDRDGALLAEETTDADGKASYDGCGPDTFVTLLVQGTGPALNAAFTYGGIAPGQTVIVGTPEPPTATAPTSDVEVTFSATNAPVSATQYRVSAGGICATTGAPPDPLSFSLEDGCLGIDADHIDVVATATDSDDQILAFDYATNVAVAAGMIPVTLDGWEDPTSVAVTVDNLPAAASEPALTLSQYRDGILHRTQTSVPMTVTDGSASSSPLQLPAAFLDEVTYRVIVPLGSDSEELFGGKTSPGDAIALDVGDAPPRLAGHLVNLSDPTRPRATILLDGDIDAGDVVTFQLGWVGGVWTIAMPARVFDGDVQFPALPDELSDLGPSATTMFAGASSSVTRLQGTTFEDVVTRGWFTGSFQNHEDDLDVGQSYAASKFSGGI